MSEQDRLKTRLKAEAFDRLVKKFLTLERDDSFYSRNWVVFSEFLEKELRELKWLLKDSG